MGRFGFWLGMLSVSIVGWWERLITGEWIGWLFGIGFHAIWWLLRAAFQTAVAAFVLVTGFGGGSQFHWPEWGQSSGQVLSLTEPLAKEFATVVKRAAWRIDDTRPEVWTILGNKYWVLIRGELDSKTHSDTDGRQMERQCLHLYAAPAVADAGKYLTPHPYNLVGMLTWPEVVVECRMTGNSTFEFPALAYKPSASDRKDMDRLIANEK